MLVIDQINKVYANGTHALNQVSLNIDTGIYGLLGPNGAGKSSLMRTLATLQRPDSGRIELNGLDILANPAQARQKIGYLPQEMGVYPRISAREMLSYLAGLKGIDHKQRGVLIEEKLEQVNLLDVADQYVEGFSGGMRRRFGIAAALLGDPELVIVDEPTAGLDPAERRRFQLLLASAAKRCILLLSSHIVEDLAGLCRDMALIKHGTIVATGSPNALLEPLEGQVWQRQVDVTQLADIQNRCQVLSWRPHQGQLVVRVLAHTQPDDAFALVGADLEDVYSSQLAEPVSL